VSWVGTCGEGELEKNVRETLKLSVFCGVILMDWGIGSEE